jgi:hypothetical protein
MSGLGEGISQLGKARSCVWGGASPSATPLRLTARLSFPSGQLRPSLFRRHDDLTAHKSQRRVPVPPRTVAGLPSLVAPPN